MTASDQRTVLARTDINSLKILRKRVRLTSDGLGKPNVVNFEDYESRKTLCVTRKPANNPKFTTVSNDTAAIRQMDIEVENAIGLYFITGTDYEVARKNSGAYAYGVSINIVDNLKSILREDGYSFFIDIFSKNLRLFKLLCNFSFSKEKIFLFKTYFILSITFEFISILFELIFIELIKNFFLILLIIFRFIIDVREKNKII